MGPKEAGTIGHVGATSFSKNLGCYGDGGAIFTNDDALASQTSRNSKSRNVRAIPP
jgi:predicted outer membrane repeat protein